MVTVWSEEAGVWESVSAMVFDTGSVSVFLLVLVRQTLVNARDVLEQPLFKYPISCLGPSTAEEKDQERITYLAGCKS